MEAWKTAVLNLVKLAGGQCSTLEMSATLILAFVTLVLVLTKVGKMFKFAMPEMGRTMMIVILGIVLSLAAMATMQIYAVPRMPASALAKASPAITAAVLLIALLVPLTCYVLKSRFFPTLFAMILSIAASVVVALFVHAIAGAMSTGGASFSKAKDEKDSVNAILDKK